MVGARLEGVVCRAMNIKMMEKRVGRAEGSMKQLEEILNPVQMYVRCFTNTAKILAMTCIFLRFNGIPLGLPRKDVRAQPRLTFCRLRK